MKSPPESKLIIHSPSSRNPVFAKHKDSPSITSLRQSPRQNSKETDMEDDFETPLIKGNVLNPDQSIVNLSVERVSGKWPPVKPKGSENSLN